MCHPAKRPAAVSALLACGVLAACGAPTEAPPSIEQSPVRPAGIDTAPVSIRLPELLPVAEVDRDTAAIDFADLTNPYLLGSGWSLEPTLGAAWGIGGESDLTFHAISAGEIKLRIRCAPFEYPGAPRQFMEVLLNGEPVERVRLWNMMRTYEVVLPAEQLRFGVNELDLLYEHSAIPADVVDGSEDNRRLAVFFEGFEFGDGLAPGEPEASSDGTLLHLPFGSRVSYYLELGEASAVRIGSTELWGESEQTSGGSWRLRIESQAEESEMQTVDLEPGRLAAPLEVVLPTERTGQRTRVSLSALSGATGRNDALGLTLDLPEVISEDEDLLGWLSRPSVPTADGRESSERPNVLIYMIDTLRADHVGVYGYEYPTSPNIDALAGEATLFRRGIAQSSWTKPSVVSIFTGLHPQLHGVNGRKDALAREAVTLAELLWEGGYETAAIYTNGTLSHMGLGQGFSHFQHLREKKDRAIHRLSDELHEEAVTWLDQRDPERPFLLYLHSTDPHAPFTPPPGYLEQIGRQVSDPDAGLIEEVLALRRNVLDEQLRDDLTALYDAEIAFNDENFGDLLKELEARDLLESTMIIVVSDHGEEFFEHRWWHHGKTLYQEQLAVPLIIRFPGGIGAGIVVEELAQHIDLLPTILDVAGINSDLELPGRSLLPLLESPASSGRVQVVSYVNMGDRMAESITTDDGKLILHHYDLGRGRLLFDLAADPDEQRNLVATNPVLAGYLRATLRALQLTRENRLSPEVGEQDEELTERLRALGYLD